MGKWPKKGRFYRFYVKWPGQVPLKPLHPISSGEVNIIIAKVAFVVSYVLCYVILVYRLYQLFNIRPYVEFLRCCVIS